MDLLSGHGVSDPRQISLVYVPPTPQQTRAVVALAAVLLFGSVALAPFAATPLQQPIVAFVPAIDAVICVTDLLTTILLLIQFSVTRSIALWALACGYLYSAILVTLHAATFPQVLTPAGNIFGGIHTNFKFYLLWHLGLPVALLAYVSLRNVYASATHSQKVTVFIGTLAFVGALVITTTIVGFYLIPSVAPLAGRWMTSIVIALCCATLVALYVFKRSALDQWLMVVLLTMVLELTITALIGGRGPAVASVGFYAGRLFSFLTPTVVLTTTFVDASRLYARLARANVLASIINATQNLSREIELSRLIELLVGIAVQYSGADRGLLILPQDDDYKIRAEARATGDQVTVKTLIASISEVDCPEGVLRTVIRSRRSVVFGGDLDGTEASLISTDRGLRFGQAKSILCSPIEQHGVLRGMLYLEHSAAPHVFTPERVQMVELLASQAAISLENARLYADLKLQVELLQQLPVSTWTLTPDGTPDFVNQVWLGFSGQTPDFVRSHPEAWMVAVHPEDREMAAKRFWQGVNSGQGFAFETRSLRARDRTYRWHLQQAVVLRDNEGNVLKFVGTTTDIDDQKRAEETLRQAQSELAHVARVATLNAMTASIAHEVNQPLSGILTNANTGLRMLSADPPNLAGAVEAARRTIRDANRASDVLKRLREMFSRKEPITGSFDLNDAARDVIAISAGELQRRGARLQTELADDLPSVRGDRVQLQQVILNLILNAADAVAEVEDRPRTLLVKTNLQDDGRVGLAVRDSGVGVDPDTVEKLFGAFYTTKADGMGVGLSICRSIIENHEGRLWGTPNDGPGSTFGFSLPIAVGPFGALHQPAVFAESS